MPNYDDQCRCQRMPNTVRACTSDTEMNAPESAIIEIKVFQTAYACLHRTSPAGSLIDSNKTIWTEEALLVDSNWFNFRCASARVTINLAFCSRSEECRNRILFEMPTYLTVVCPTYLALLGSDTYLCSLRRQRFSKKRIMTEYKQIKYTIVSAPLVRIAGIMFEHD